MGPRISGFFRLHTTKILSALSTICLTRPTLGYSFPPSRKNFLKLLSIENRSERRIVRCLFPRPTPCASQTTSGRRSVPLSRTAYPFHPRIVANRRKNFWSQFRSQYYRSPASAGVEEESRFTAAAAIFLSHF